MPLPTPIALDKFTYKVSKTGLPFYDAAHLIGVAHFFLGTASAEVQDEGSYWIVSGISVNRDDVQTDWVIEDAKAKAWDLKQKSDQLTEALLFVRTGEAFQSKEFRGIKLAETHHKLYPALKEFDACIQYGPRGFDPLKDWAIISSQGTKPKRKEKIFGLSAEDLITVSLGFGFSAFTRSGKYRSYILPIFRERFVLSGFLTYQRSFSHPAGGFVVEIMASISILLDLVSRKLPVIDFVYTRIFGHNVFSSSGYLGLERLCQYWWKAVCEEKQDTLRLLRNFRQFLQATTGPDIDEQVQSLARWIADFVANPNVDALIKIEQLKARIVAASQSQPIRGDNAVKRLLNHSAFIKEVKAMMESNLPEVPRQVSEALARSLGFDEKGWMNQFTRLENAGNFSQFIQQVEHIVSRGFYREQQEQGQLPDIREALTRARDLANILCGIETQLRDEKAFRAWKAIFLLDVLSRARFKKETSIEASAQAGIEEVSTSEN
jgi:hypothetical protein